MAVVLSSYPFTVPDQSGNPQALPMLLVEFRAASYQPGGEFVDLTPHMRYGVGAVFGPISGALVDKLFGINQSDLPTAGLISARIQIFRAAGSAAVFTEMLSGTAISGVRTWMLMRGY